MATGNKLEVQIGVDNTELKKGIQEAVISLEKLRQQKSANLKVGLDVSALNTQIASAKTNLATLQKQTVSTTSAMGGFQKGTVNGGNALMQFSRIAQDAPYGIIGIGNNLTATAEAFSYLKNQTGSTGGALKALANSLMGTGGILLGISLLTTGFTLLSQSGLSVGDLIDKLTGDFNEFSDSIKKASDEAVKSTISEVSSLKELIFVAQNETKSKKERLSAVSELQKLYPGYFGNLTQEKILTGDLTAITQELTKALINKAIAEKLTDSAVAPTLKLYHANALLLSLKKEQLQAETQLNEAVKRGDSAQSLAFYSNNLKKVNDKLGETRGTIIKTTNETNRLQDAINKIGGTASKLLIKTVPKEKAASVAKPKKEKVNPNAGNEFRPFLQEFTGAVVPELALTFKDPTEGFTAWNEKVVAGLTTAEQALLDFNYNAAALISTSIGDTFGQLGTVIGEALVNGGNVLSAIGTTLLQSLGKFLSDMGGMLIQYGTLAVVKGKLDLAILTGGPVAIAAGIAAIGIGVALKAIGGAIGAKAKGGAGGNTSTSTGSGANNTSTTYGGGSFSSSGGGTVVFEIAGTSLIGVLNNTTSRNLRLGGK